MMFLINDINKWNLNEIMDIDVDIKRAEERLEYLSADPQTQELYFEREKAIHDQANIYSTGVRRGMEQGIELGRSEGLELGRMNEKISIAKELLDILPIDVIAKKTGLTEEDVLNLERDK
jgi:predicted transposase/invertase (TIGR01784 family)